MPDNIVRITLRKSDFSKSFDWRNFCEAIGVDHIGIAIEVAILKDESSSS